MVWYGYGMVMVWYGMVVIVIVIFISPNDSYFYSFQVTPERIEILATTVSIDEEDIDPCKDFYLQATSLSLKGTLRWKGRNVYIVAVNLTVVDNETTIDVSYQSPGQPDYKVPAASGSRDGQAGSNG